jgi:aspartate kinase
MQEMSAAGAKVLNTQAVQFAKEKQIAVYARSTFDPGRETVIRKLPPGAVVGVQAVVSERAIVRVKLHGENLLSRFRAAAEWLESEQVPIKEVSLVAAREQGKASFVVSLANIYDWATIEARLESLAGPNINFDTDLGALSLIGEGLNNDSTILTATLELLEQRGVQVTGVTTTSFRISLLVPLNRIDTAVGLCHGKWIAQ